MTETNTDTVDRRDVRKLIRATIQNADTDGADYEDVVGIVANKPGVTKEHVRDELDALERNGFVYLVNGTVKLP